MPSVGISHGDLLEVERLMEVAERLGFEDVAAAQDQRPLDHVLELSDVARPPDEVGGQERDVLPSLPKGRQEDRDDVQPVARAGLWPSAP